MRVSWSWSRCGLMAHADYLVMWSVAECNLTTVTDSLTDKKPVWSYQTFGVYDSMPGCFLRCVRITDVVKEQRPPTGSESWVYSETNYVRNIILIILINNTGEWGGYLLGNSCPSSTIMSVSDCTLTRCPQPNLYWILILSCFFCPVAVHGEPHSINVDIMLDQAGSH